ncbi:hypothetical protein GGS20DRAFT_474571 [Poronia punctata]|nr:hypothetical protein GGS20DRAFT_474571 [Poronia punctata]
MRPPYALLITFTFTFTFTSTIVIANSLKTLLLPLCCCCQSLSTDLYGPQPTDLTYYTGTCSREGVIDVCGDDYTGSSGYTLPGYQGEPEKIRSACSIARCRPLLFVD